MNISRSKFESLVASLLERTKKPCLDCMKDAGVSAKDIQEVLLVGGMSRMPKVWCRTFSCVFVLDTPPLCFFP